MQNASKEHTPTKSKKANKRRNSRKKSLSPSNSTVTPQPLTNGTKTQTTAIKPECKRSLSEGSVKTKHTRKSNLKRTHSHPSTDSLPFKDEAKKETVVDNSKSVQKQNNQNSNEVRSQPVVNSSERNESNENECETNDLTSKDQVGNKKKHKQNNKIVNSATKSNRNSVVSNNCDIINSALENVPNSDSVTASDVPSSIDQKSNLSSNDKIVEQNSQEKKVDENASRHKDAIEILNEEIQARFKEGIKSFADQLAAAATLKPGYINAELTRIFQEQARDPMIKFARQHVSHDVGNELESLPGASVKRVPVKRRRRVPDIGELYSIHFSIIITKDNYEYSK